MTCKNCSFQLSDHSDYCNKCGAKVIRNRLTLKNLFEHVSETFFNYDNKLLRTFVDLFKKPEAVIGGYINGIRKRYVNVISYFALAITLSGLQILIIQKFQTDLTLYDTTTEVGLRQQAMFDKTYKFMNDYQSLVMMLYIPLYALMAKIVFFRVKTFNYTELLVIFLYAQAQFSICIALITAIVIPFNLISFAALGMLILPIQFFYFAYCLKRLYQLNTGQIILRTLIFFVVLAVVFIIFTLIMVLTMILNGDMQQLIEAQKAAKSGG
ncbi:DUF3667 domain-containing protein [Winogradskyella sp. 3972H.M.0a.05]|uniref:DUF3667 domain-containing protein n=1 Tax=Winogradskyella sp. 3972H.M.0a.05 TaxID=2950277 RepID=UPI0033987FBD